MDQTPSHGDEPAEPTRRTTASRANADGYDTDHPTREQAQTFGKLLQAASRWLTEDPSSGVDGATPAETLGQGAGRVIENVGHALAAMAEALLPALATLAQLEDQRPANWTGVAFYPRVLPLLADGFPVLWVPAADELAAMAAAPDRPARQAVLVEHVLDHARLVLDEVTSPELAEAAVLARRALDAVADHPSPAQVLGLQVATIVALDEAGVDSFYELRPQLKEKVDRLARLDHAALISELGLSLTLTHHGPGPQGLLDQTRCRIQIPGPLRTSARCRCQIRHG